MFHFLKSSSRTRASPSVLLDTGYYGPDDTPAFREKVGASYLNCHLFVGLPDLKKKCITKNTFFSPSKHFDWKHTPQLNFVFMGKYVSSYVISTNIVVSEPLTQ
jgi:hypothetical protein